jgi:hypothetical protein
MSTFTTSKKTWSAAAAVGALLAGCAAVAPEVATWNIPPAGSTWQTVQRNTGSYGKDAQLQITRGNGVWQGKPAVEIKNSAGFTIMATEDGRWYGILGRDGKPFMTYDPPIGFVYPLKVGKAWSTHHRMTMVATGKVTEFDYACKVEAFEPVTVRAGTFDTFRIACTTPGAQDTYWSSRDHGMMVKTDFKRTSAHQMGAGTQQSELVALNLRK